MKRFLSTLFALAGLTVLLSACNAAQNPTIDTSMIQTFAAQTAVVRQTLSALETKVIQLTLQPTQAPVIITATPQAASRTPLPSATPLASATPQASATRVPASATPQPTATSGPACNAAKFVKDMTIEDGATLAPDAAFTKTWRLRNDGSCVWTTGYAIVFSSGEAMSGPAEVKLSKAVNPGETVDLSVNLVSPKTTGSYTGNWLLRSASGEKFGTGANDAAFYVKISVAVASMTDLHLTNGYCNATWKAQGGAVTCPTGTYNFTDGAVKVVTNPKLPGGSVDDEPALVMVPNNGTGGQIVGRYPKFGVKSGDHFVTLLGCLDTYKDCTVTFTLAYSVNGGADTNLGSWDMTFAGPFKHVDVDLTSLAGKDVQFVLMVGNKDNNSKDDVAFWLNPHIVRP